MKYLYLIVIIVICTLIVAFLKVNLLIVFGIVIVLFLTSVYINTRFVRDIDPHASNLAWALRYGAIAILILSISFLLFVSAFMPG